MTRAAWVLLLAVTAGCGSTGPGQTVSPEPSPPTISTAAEPAATPLPEALPHAPAPAAVEGEIGDRPIRVLLRRTTETVLLPQPGRAYRIETSGDARWIHGPIEVTVAGDHAWQVGAYSSPKAAGMVADRLEADLGGDVLVWQEAAGGSLVRVKLRWPDGAPADAERQLAAAGFEDAFRVPVGSVIRIEGDDASVESGDEIVLTPARVWPTSVGGRLYRGRFRLRVAGGDLLFINELDMETYLRGVVPVEMGPYVFPELEALKAQAVAARTYAVAHLGDHDEEGWDICATPACQAYHGASAEHDLSDRAVAETAGLVAVYLGAPIDAMYTSTCGGHTEDAALLFPDRAQPYLTGVACAWDRPLRLAGVGGPGPLMTRESHHAEVARALLGLSATATPGELVREVNELTGVTAHLLASTDVESFSLALLTAAGIDAPTTVTRASSGLDALLGLCDLFGSGLSPPSSGLAGDWPAAATLAVLELSGVVVRDRGEAVPHTDGPAIYPRRAETSEPLPLPLALWERWADGFRRVPDLEVLPGTPLERLRLGDRVVALVAERSGGADEADRRSAWRSWARERDWDELALRLEIPDLERLSVTRRGGSGRVVEMVAQGRSGTVRRLEGFPIRRSLDLPENLFTMFVIRRPDGTRAVRFLGRGWGHGVGLCQNGAYGLARAGMTFDRILAHYYTGVEIGVWDAR